MGGRGLYQRLVSVGSRRIANYQFTNRNAGVDKQSWRRPPSSDSGAWKHEYDNAEKEQRLRALVKVINKEIERYPTIPSIPEPPLASEKNQPSQEWKEFCQTPEWTSTSAKTLDIQGTEQLDLDRYMELLAAEVSLTLPGFKKALQESLLPEAVPPIPVTAEPLSRSGGGGDGGSGRPKRPRLDDSASGTAPAPPPWLWAQMIDLHEALHDHYEGGSNHPQLQPSALQGSDKEHIVELHRILTVILYEGDAAVKAAPLVLPPPSPRPRGGKRRMVQQLREVVEHLYSALGYGAY